MRINSLTGLAAILGVVLSSSATQAADQQRCLEAAELSNVVVSLLPTAISQMKAKCAASLPGNAALNLLSDGRIAEYQSAAALARPAAAIAMKRMMGSDLPSSMPAEAIFPFVEGIVSAGLSDKLPAGACPIANNIWSALEPLPPQNWGSLLSAILLAAQPPETSTGRRPSDSKAPFGDLHICPYVATSI